MYAIIIDGKRFGTVMKFVGNPRSQRWVAFISGERRKGFPARWQAIRWAGEQATADDNAVSTEAKPC